MRATMPGKALMYIPDITVNESNALSLRNRDVRGEQQALVERDGPGRRTAHHWRTGLRLAMGCLCSRCLESPLLAKQFTTTSSP